MTIKKTKLLKDVPTTSDAFGTHEKIAELLRQELLSSEEGRSIALVGDWGSGKSTVIEILRKLLSQDSDIPTHIFIYDAWSHQGDSLRRAFLDDFITSLKEHLKEEQTSNAANRVWNRTETTTTTREPVLRRHAKVLLLSLALVPLGMELFQLHSKNGEIPWTALCNWNNILALIFIAAPVLCTLFYGLINKINIQGIRKFFFGNSGEGQNFSVLSFFFERVQGNIERKEIKSPIDSIATFRDVFSQIVNDVHSNKSNLRIIIVIDNIDRIPANQAREFWSTMQTFFGDGGGPRQPHSMKYWLLAPFSVEALSFIFGDTALGTISAPPDSLDTNRGNTPEKRTSPALREDAKVRAKAYIDKTFGLAFYVPPPILSNWRSYFLDCLKEAFFEHNQADLEAVRDVYDFGRLGTEFVTPRDIKLFVNSLVALYRQRGEDVPLTLMASYLRHREEINGIDIADDLISSREIRAIGVSDWRAMMAALHFGVPKDEGGQLLLHEPVVSALRDGSIENLKTLETRPGFSDVLRKVVVDELGTAEAENGTTLAQLATTLNSLECSERGDASHIWQDIGRSLRSVRDWSGLHQSPADGIGVIIRHASATRRVALCNTVAKSLSRAQLGITDSETENLNKFAANWAATAKAILDAGDWSSEIEIEIPRAASTALAIIKELPALDIEPASLQAFRTKTSPSDLSSQIVSDITSGVSFPSADRLVIGVIQAMQLKLKWSEIGASIAERMSIADSKDDEIQSYLSLLLSAYGSDMFPDSVSVLKKLSTQGHFSHLLHRHRKNSETCGIILLATILANPNLERPNHANESQQGDAEIDAIIGAADLDDNIVSAISEAAERCDVADLLFGIGAETSRFGRLVAAVIGSLAESSYQFGVAPETVIENWAYIEQNADLVSESDLLKSLKEFDRLLASLASDSFEVNRTRLYRSTIAVASNSGEAYWNFLKNGISSVTKDDWAAALTAQEGPHFELVELVSELRGAGHDVYLEVPAKDAILDFIRSVVEGGQKHSDTIRGRVASIIDLLQDGYRESLVRDITDDMMGLTDADRSVRLVEIAGPEITFRHVTEPEKIVRRVFSPLVTKPTKRTIACMNNVVEGKGESFWSLPREAKGELASRLGASLHGDEEMSEELKSALEELAGRFGIDVYPQDSADAEHQPE